MMHYVIHLRSKQEGLYDFSCNLYLFEKDQREYKYRLKIHDLVIVFTTYSQYRKTFNKYYFFYSSIFFVLFYFLVYLKPKHITYSLSFVFNYIMILKRCIAYNLIFNFFFLGNHKSNSECFKEGVYLYSNFKQSIIIQR